MPNIPVNGLSGLGAVIAGAGADYLGRTRQLQDESRRRTQQLEDVQSARNYSDTVRHEERTNRLADEETSEHRRLRAAAILTLQNEGLLSPGQENNPEAVAAAYAEAQRRGLDKLYQELLSTPGPDGQPLLTQADIANPAKVQAAKDALGKLKADQVKFGLDQRGNAQSTVDNIQNQLAQVRARSADIAGRIDAPPRQFGPTDQQVLTLAAQMADQAKPGSGRNREAVASMVPIAQKQLNDNSLISHAQSVQSATRELESLRYNEAQLTNALRETIQTFKVAPSAKAGTTVLQQPSAATTAPKAANADQMAAAMDAVLGKQPAAAPAGATPGAVALANPTSDPIIAKENERRSAETWRTTLANPFNEAMDRVDKIKAEIERVRAGAPPASAPPPGLFGAPADLYSNPTIKANSLSALLVELEKAQADADRARRAMLGVPSVPAPSIAAPPTAGAVLSNPVGASSPAAPAAPAWWKTQGPVPAMGL